MFLNFIKKNIFELIKYGFYGVVTTTFNLVLFYGMIKVGIHYIVANVVSYSLAVILSYYLNNRFVFVNQHNTDKRQKTDIFIKFIIVRIIALIADSALLAFFVDFLGADVMLSRIFLSFLIILATYIFNKFFVFSIIKREED